MLAGKLRHKVTIQRLTGEQDEIGQPLPSTWTDVATVWADIRYLRGLEAVKADASVSVSDCSIRIRKRDGINAGMRVVEGTTYYDIRAVLPDATGMEYLDLTCKQGANNG